MKKILFTGGTGFLGRNLVPVLSEKYNVISPTRMDLNLKNLDGLEAFIKNNNFDVIIHAAIPNLAFNKDSKETFLRDSLTTFLKLHQLQECYGKMIYFGSGAEFDKSVPIVNISEMDFGLRIPETDYGLSKYIMNLLCRESKNIYNLRIFGCYGPTDAHFKLITYVIRCCLKNEPIYLHQNCKFDYMLVTDLFPVLDYFIENTPKYHDYNVCTGRSVELLEICRIIQKELNSSVPVHIEQAGFNKEYSGNNQRIFQEIPNLCFTPLLQGIREQILWEKEQIVYEKKSI